MTRVKSLVEVLVKGKNENCIVTNIHSFYTSAEPSVSRMRILASRRGLTNDERKDGRRLGSDSHADISVAGRHARVLSYVDGHVCTVHPFHDRYQPKKNVKVANVAYAYDA